MNTAGRIQEGAEKLLELSETGRTYEEIAEALGRTIGSVDSKLTRLRKRQGEANEMNEPIYREGECLPTAELPEAQQIYDELLLALLDEFVNDLAYGSSSSLCVAP